MRKTVAVLLLAVFPFPAKLIARQAAVAAVPSASLMKNPRSTGCRAAEPKR